MTGTAWAIPAVAVATAAPALAASPGACAYVFTISDTSCRRLAFGGYRLVINITRDPGCTDGFNGFTLYATADGSLQPTGYPRVGFSSRPTGAISGPVLLEFTTKNQLQSLSLALTYGGRTVGETTLAIPATAQDTCPYY